MASFISWCVAHHCGADVEPTLHCWLDPQLLCLFSEWAHYVTWSPWGFCIFEDMPSDLVLNKAQQFIVYSLCVSFCVSVCVPACRAHWYFFKTKRNKYKTLAFEMSEMQLIRHRYIIFWSVHRMVGEILTCFTWQGLWFPVMTRNSATMEDWREEVLKSNGAAAFRCYKKTAFFPSSPLWPRTCGNVLFFSSYASLSIL